MLYESSKPVSLLINNSTVDLLELISFFSSRPSAAFNIANNIKNSEMKKSGNSFLIYKSISIPVSPAVVIVVNCSKHIERLRTFKHFSM